MGSISDSLEGPRELWHGEQDPWALETVDLGYSQILSESQCSKRCRQCGMKDVFWAQLWGH